MRSSELSLAASLLLPLVLAAACGGPTKAKTMYWRGEMWDGMNRMAFALQDLGWHLDTVDTDHGKIIASMGRGGGAGTERDLQGEGSDKAAARDFYKILIQFSADPDVPIAIGAVDQSDESYRTPKFLRIVSDITKRFEWYGGKSLEVVG